MDYTIHTVVFDMSFCIFLVKVKLSCPRALSLSLSLSLSHVILYLFEGRIFMLIESSFSQCLMGSVMVS